VRLGYDISSIPASLFRPPISGDGDYAERRVWVVLRKGADGVFSAAAASFARENLPPAQPGDVVLAGTAAGAPATGGSASIEYGIERFYLPEGKGKPIEVDMRTRPFFVVAAVGDSGTAQIKRFLDGETVLFEEPIY